jgi:hypothetical protein
LHDRYSFFINWLLEGWSAAFCAEGTDAESITISDVYSRFEQFHEDLSRTVPEIPALEDLIDVIRYVLSECRVKTANAAPGNDTEVSWGSHNFHILVGGQALERGFTIQGLTVTYMPRPLGVGNADGMQQRARFFGYRENLLSITRVFLPPSVQDAFSTYVDHERHFRESIYEFSQTDADFSLWTRRFLIDSALRPTRQNVIGRNLWRSDLHEWNQLVPDLQNQESVASFKNAWEALNQKASWAFSTDPMWEYEREESGSKARHMISAISAEKLLHFLEQLRSPQCDQYPALFALLAWSLRQGRNPDIQLALMRRGEEGERSPGSTTGSYNLQAGRSGSYTGDRSVFFANAVTIQVHHTRFGLPGGGIVGPVPGFAIRYPECLRHMDIIEQA